MYKPWPERTYPPAWRVALAFLIAPAFGALLMAVFAAAAVSFETLWPTTLLIAAIGAYPPAILFGIPAYFVLRRHWGANPIGCGLVGAAIAALPWLPFVLFPSTQSASVDGEATVIDGRYTAYGWLEIVEVLSLLAGLGLAAGIVFWVIAAAGHRSEAS
jgi:hypothetical protein